MKLAALVVAVSLSLLGTVLANAQSTPLQFQHVIIVVQENRTPDNLFGGVPGPNGTPPFEAGADLATAPNSVEWSLGACFNPGHEHRAWQDQHDNGYPDQTRNPGQCGQSPGKGGNVTYCCSPPSNAVMPRPVCGQDQYGAWVGCSGSNPINVPDWPEESYVSWTYEQTYDQNGAHHVLDPYIQIASQYGFANYFFQTNEGASEPAHDFLFGGTSAFTGDPTQNYFNYFAYDNPGSSPVGCESSVYLGLIDQYGVYPDGSTNPCFEHLTLSDLLEANHLTWQYYTSQHNGIWTAPNTIQHICLTSNTQPPAQCNNTDYTNNVVWPSNKFFKDFPSGGPNLPMNQPCALPSVAWIIPDGANSDHPGPKNDQSGTFYSTDIEGGPNWVASIVNAVGQAKCYDVVNGQHVSPWQDTAILIVWDDWGGWYDHVLAGYEYNRLGQNELCIPEYNNLPWGCGYTYGFRVPFLVVSAYTPAGTISGKCGTSGAPACGALSNAAPHQHDFGSILAFIEYNFKLGIGCINLPSPVTGRDGIPCQNNPNGPPAGNYPFADYYAPEVIAGYAPLSDFFTSQAPRSFTPINLFNNSFTLDYFKNFNGPFTDPDNDMVDNH